MLFLSMMFLVSPLFAQTTVRPGRYRLPYYYRYGGYINPPLRDAEYRTAKDYWRQKREALDKGVRLFPSAAELNDGFMANKKTQETPVKKVIESIRKAADEIEEEKNETPSTPPTLWKPDQQASQSLVELERSSTKRILRELLGEKYVSIGGRPGDGFSPTGLVCYVLGRLGRPVKECTTEHFWNNAGTFIEEGLYQFQPGDILFFSLFSKSEQENTLMIAICFDESEMVYSSFTRKKVIMRSYRQKFWRERFVGAKRILY